ncbi:TIGR04282 family arsenosugar biosynthesis glycosyltransferase [Thermogemmata fonticola]|uniref:Glycosyltransferase n=1 Tax=Thermogemmata fonticola TaxID=2755323 RepID=A0A7V9AC01_9BACT|nr:TIGR04282 family arsenosugar biosynthesis glycosyltransferase [Thermogemmata fonticola]MBA2226282.1 glycosyltransferase [Thermogemmata fonticola]
MHALLAMPALLPSLLVFLKYPAAGKVKTRLGAAVGFQEAAALYRTWIDRLLQNIQPLRRQARLIALYDGAPWEDFAPWHHLCDLWWVQKSGPLGERLAAAFQQAYLLAQKEAPLPSDLPSVSNSAALEQLHGGAVETASSLELSKHFPVCAIGTDCLELDVPLLQKSFELLQQYDVVIGPSFDGGYYLIGTASFRPRLFDNIRWSSRWTLEDQVQQCRILGCSVAYLPPRWDIDTLEDWQAYCQRCQSSASQGTPS